MRFYGIDPNTLDMERFYGLWDRIVDVMEMENPVDPFSEAGANRTRAQLERSVRRRKETEYADCS